MFTIEYTDNVKKVLDKVKNRNPILYKSIERKIEQIAENPYRFKPLRYDLKHYRRVYVKEPYVLVYKIDEKNWSGLKIYYRVWEDNNSRYRSS